MYNLKLTYLEKDILALTYSLSPSLARVLLRESKFNNYPTTIEKKGENTYENPDIIKEIKGSFLQDPTNGHMGQADSMSHSGEAFVIFFASQPTACQVTACPVRSTRAKAEKERKRQRESILLLWPRMCQGGQSHKSSGSEQLKLVRTARLALTTACLSV